MYVGGGGGGGQNGGMIELNRSFCPQEGAGLIRGGINIIYGIWNNLERGLMNNTRSIDPYC